MNGRIYDPVLARFLSPDPFVQMPDFTQSYNRYSYCLNNPFSYTDPSGEFFWIIPSISWSKEGGLSFGISVVFGIPGVVSAQVGVGYNVKGNDFNVYAGVTAAFNTVYASYSTNSGFSVGWSAGFSPQMGLPISTNFLTAGLNYNITHNSLSGNLSAWTIDGKGATFNPSISVMVFPEQTTNLVRGQGFRSNDQVFDRMMAGDYTCQQILDYFGFEGVYDPYKKTPGYDLEKNGYCGATNSAGKISYGDLAFSSYGRLKATYYKELYHSNKAKAGTPFSTQEVPEGFPSYLKVFPEEWEGFIYQYKNQGLYRGFASMNNISYYQNGILNLNPSQYYLPQWWHFIYKIPRKW
jgi:hypothetical protein